MPAEIFFLHVIIQITSKLLTLLDWRVSLQTRRTFSTPFTSADPEMPQWNRKTELKPKSSHGHLFASQPICAHLAVLEQESELLSHMPTLCSPALLLFPLIPPVNLVLHQLVITHHNSPSTMPLRTNHAPTFQSLWRLPLQCLATNLSTCRRPPFKSQTKVEQAWPVVTHILWSMCLVKGRILCTQRPCTCKTCESIHPSMPADFVLSANPFLCHFSYICKTLFLCPSQLISLPPGLSSPSHHSHAHSCLPVSSFFSFSTLSSSISLHLVSFQRPWAYSSISHSCLWRWRLREGKSSPLWNMEAIITRLASVPEVWRCRGVKSVKLFKHKF